MELFSRFADEFTEEDRRGCIEIINKIIELANVTRQYGLLALESHIKDNEDFLLRMAVALIVDGTDPLIVKDILYNFILSGSYNSYEKLNACIITEGLLSVQLGENPRLIQLKLASMLGEKICAEQFGKEIMRTNQQERYLEALSKLEDIKPEPLDECRQFEAFILGINDMSIQRILRETTNNDCIVAFCGCSFRGIKKLLNNVSLRLAEMILCDILNCSANRQYVLEAQERILSHIKALENTGEIITHMISF